jgi:ankyrin repeat protein
MEIFEIIKSKNFTELKKYVETEDINYDIYDENNNYLIHYILNFNLSKILKILLKKNIRLDILDTDGRNILYIAIKFNYIDCLIMLLDNDKNQIGISIINIKDNIGNTCLHYAILFKNIEVVEILLKYDINLLLRNNDDLNCLELALQENNNDIFLKILNSQSNIDFVNKKNENILQYAVNLQNFECIEYILKKDAFIDLNNKENENGLSVLHLTIMHNNLHIMHSIINNNADINNTDFYGNNILMYAILLNRVDIINDLINNDKINFNAINIDGNTALHILLKNKLEIDNTVYETLIEHTDLEIQDNIGNTCLYYLIKNKVFLKYQRLLENKLLNIFINNNNNITTYDLIKNNNKYLLIIANSFYNYLKKNKNKLLVEWEIWCSDTDIKTNLNSILQDSKDQQTKTKICIDKIINLIKKDKRSIPKIKHMELHLEEEIFIDKCKFIGSTIEIICGCLYLKSLYKNLNLIIDFPLTENAKLKKHYESLGLDYSYKLDFCNLEIIWSYQELFFPSYFNSKFKIIFENSDHIFIPLGIECHNGAHLNILFIDCKNNTIERFEPNGKYEPVGLEYNHNLLDNLLKTKFLEFNKKFIYKTPMDYLPPIGFQILENYQFKNCNLESDPNGFCVVWCFWWIDQKMKNLDFDSKELVEKLIKEIKFKNISFKKLIRTYSHKITNLRDIFLKKYNLDINDYITNNFNSVILNKLEKDFLNFKPLCYKKLSCSISSLLPK